jgi:L-threonylcarbamoyladenylate synthase
LPKSRTFDTQFRIFGGRRTVAKILPESEAMNEAAELLQRGRIVAVPTETVYGLAGDATNGLAVAAIFEAKGRPRFNPLICHVSGMQMARSIACFSPLAEKLSGAFWSGPLTLVLPLAEGAAVHPLVCAGLDTVALRMPRGFVARLAGKLGVPLAAPSANRSGRITATTALAVDAELGDRVDLIVDGGPCEIGVESTIVKVDADRMFLLRPGGVAVDEIESVAETKVERLGSGDAIQAPGMMASHYAPHAEMRLNANIIRPGEALLGFGPGGSAYRKQASTFLNLSETGDLREAAANLFSMLRKLDEADAGTIAVEPIPGTGLGEAINDRLSRAAAPRDTDAAPS